MADKTYEYEADEYSSYSTDRKPVTKKPKAQDADRTGVQYKDKKHKS